MYITISTFKPVYLSLHLCACPLHFMISNCCSCIRNFDLWKLLGVRWEKYLCILVPLRPKRFMRSGKAELSYIDDNIKQGEAKPHLPKLIPVFHHLPSVVPEQLCALANLGYMHPRRGYFLQYIYHLQDGKGWFAWKITILSIWFEICQYISDVCVTLKLI